MLRISVFFALSLLGLSASMAQADDAGHLRLKDRLDRPGDGYCLDVLGVGRSLRLELPLFAHNCKRGLTADSAIMMRDDGKIMFRDLDLCITAAGVNGRALPGAAIILRGCGHNAPFFESGPLQTFTWREGGALALHGTDLCLAVGSASDATYASQDRWRVLSVEDCKTTPVKFRSWEFHTGPFAGG